MRILSFILLTLVGTMILGLPLQSYADPQLDILLNIATQARDDLGNTISQTSNVSNEIKQLYQQGSDETDQLANAINQQDTVSAKQHFLAAMKFFKETNDKINSLSTPASNDQQTAEITQLRGEIVRLNNMENLLRTIATANNVQVDFTKFDDLIQTAQQDLDSGNVSDATTVIKTADDFLIETHNSFTMVAKERALARAKDFTEKEIERFSKMNGFNATGSTTTSSTTSENTTVSTAPSIPPSISPPSTTPENTTVSTAPSIPPSISPPSTTPENTTVSTTSSSTTVQPSETIQNNASIVNTQNPEEMLAELKKLVSEGKVNEALKMIKIIEAYQNEKLSNSEGTEHPSYANVPKVTENVNNGSTATNPPPSPPPENTTVSTPPSIPPPISPPPIHGEHEKHQLENNRHNKELQNNDH